MSNLWNHSKANSDILHRQRIRQHILHQYKLQQIKPIIDTRPPKSLKHRQTKSNSLQTTLRQQEIQKHNQMLLQKIIAIDSKPSLAMTSNYPHKKSRKSSFHKELSLSNLQILRKLNSSKSHYSTKRWNQDFQYSRYLLSQLSENAKRYPKTTSFNGISRNESINSKLIRPYSAKHFNL